MLLSTSYPRQHRYAHILEDDRIILCLVDSQGNILIFIDRLSRIDAAIQSQSYAKFINQDKIGQPCLFAYDESKRMLAIYAPVKVCARPDLLRHRERRFIDATPYVRI